MERSLLIELIQSTKNTLDAIKNITQLSRGRFSNKEFGDYFLRVINRDIEQNNLLLEVFLNYIKATTPVRKKDTVNTLIDETVKNLQAQLEERKAKVFKKFEQELPETIVPERQLGFILDTVLRYAMNVMPLDGSIEFFTRSFPPRGDSGENLVFFDKNGKYVEILMAFTGHKRPEEPFGKGLGTPADHKKVELDLLLQMVDVMVQTNRGRLELKSDETNAKKMISLKFPCERRKAVDYPLTINKMKRNSTHRI